MSSAVSSQPEWAADDGATRADALRQALVALGLDVDARAEGAMAVLRPRRPRSLPELSRHRGEVVQLARVHGFSHVAVELDAVGAVDESSGG